MPNVYVVSDSGHDFTSAEPFGDLVIMTKGWVDKYNVTEMLRIFAEKMADSKPTDFILQSGPAVMTAVACSIFSAKHQCLNLLIWRVDGPGKESYTYRRLDFSRMKEGEEDGTCAR